jgi:hypothetical protein
MPEGAEALRQALGIIQPVDPDDQVLARRTGVAPRRRPAALGDLLESRGRRCRSG